MAQRLKNLGTSRAGKAALVAASSLVLPPCRRRRAPSS